MKNARSFNIPESTLLAVIQYLSTCPYAQVNKLITELGENIQRSMEESKKPAETPKPATKPAK